MLFQNSNTQFYTQQMNSKLSVLFLLFILFGCKTTYQTQVFQQKNIPAAPDYNDESTWAVLPYNYPEELKQFSPQNIGALKADVFFIYPTLNTDKKDNRWNVPFDDIVQQKKVITAAVKYQASPFITSGKLYVPYYRQAHLRSYRRYEGRVEALKVAYSDVKKAFEIYLKKYNYGRPIIIVSHSQGTTHAIRLLADFFDGKPLRKRLIAAYIPGIRIKPNQYKTIFSMTSPTATGGFVSWNTRKKGTYPDAKDWYAGSVTTNPITWDATIKTTREQHKGFLFTNDVLYKNALIIEITDGLVWSTVPRFPKRFLMSFIKSYHTGDINLFWQDIKENVELRTKVWLETNE